MQKVTYKGKQYKSLTFACDLLGVSDALVRYYTRNGMTFEQAVEQILKNKKRNNCTDHLGNEFESLKSMALAYWLPPTVLYQRLHRKWDLKHALTTPDGKPRGRYVNKCTDHLGNKFESRKAMAEFYNIPCRALNRRLEREWSLERALTTPNGKPRGKHANKVQGQKI